MTRRALAVPCVLAVLLSFSADPVRGADIWWSDGDGSTGTYSGATWTNLQSAIDSAVGGGNRGTVKICGDLMRATGATQLLVRTGNVLITGGWTWNAGAEPAAQGGRSTLDANFAALGTYSRVLDIDSAPDTALDSLQVMGGRINGSLGGGIYIHGTSDRVAMDNLLVCTNKADGVSGGGIAVDGSAELTGLRISHCEITNNWSFGWNKVGGALYLANAGSQAAPMLIEHTTVANNCAGGSDNAGTTIHLASGWLTIANSFILNNSSRDGVAVFRGGEGILTLFGTLVAGNRREDGAPGGQVIRSGAAKSGFGSRLVNCTIAGNNRAVLYTVSNGWNAQTLQPHNLVLINTIVDESKLSAAWDAVYHTYTHVDLQNSTLQVGTCEAQDSAGWHPATPTNSLLGALALQDNQPTNRFHSVNNAGGRTQDLEANIDGPAGFLGTGPHPYQLGKNKEQSVNAVDNGRMIWSAGGYAFVDVDTDGIYDAGSDVIVAGTPPGGTHLVYKTDLQGYPRIKGGMIDRGAYEFQPPKGLVVMFR